MIADDTLHLFTFNFTRTDTRKSRGFGVSTRDKSTLKQACELFEADCTRQTFTPKSGCLVVSPENARDALTAFIKDAKRQLLVYDVNIQDGAFIQLLKARMAAGVDVRVIGKAKGSGLDVRPLATMRLHARAIVRDGAKVFVGSQSLRRPELNLRREVGVIISNAAVARQLRDLFEADWKDSAPKEELEKEEQADKDEKEKTASPAA
jgi:phosphatidylserine/phosphatidylglycerophosphate/cardiolipin synthase-like enzyme